ncbi:telomeric repeat-binding factor 2-interacting protein 1-like [Xenia sp. Carnegie-2017]|uniref:telomeric repeat-binding factor 2-interacting protein 1-like n=1 Tax=Xenia sp. Carnegie-2017 TaxID=2897299 RepID=UPI001F03F723|nr:telomeric repeat-binding factor 2-interacting protein 1-like [Xenia sp. Carnegie-2017]
MAEHVAGKKRYYTDDEDYRILTYINKVKKSASGESLGLQGRVIWIDMMKKNILPGRSWKSLRNRYENYLKKIELTTSGN